MRLEQLPDRINPVVFAVNSGGILTVFGDGAVNKINISESGGLVSVIHNDAPVTIAGLPPQEDKLAMVRVFASAGNDVIEIDGTVDVSSSIVGGAGDDTLTGSALFPNNLDGQDGNDLIVGGAGNDRIFGGNGNDLILAGVGDDDIFGQVGDDTIFGGAGNDSLRGGEGNDLLCGDSGSDFMDGFSGNDVLLANDGEADTVHGGTGIDVILADSIDSMTDD